MRKKRSIGLSAVSIISYYAVCLGCAPCRMGHCPAHTTKTTLEDSFLFSSREKQRGIPCCNSLLERHLLWKCTHIGLWDFLLSEAKDPKAWKIKDFQREQKGRMGKHRCFLERGWLKADPSDPRMQLHYVLASQRLGANLMFLRLSNWGSLKSKMHQPKLPLNFLQLISNILEDHFTYKNNK